MNSSTSGNREEAREMNETKSEAPSLLELLRDNGGELDAEELAYQAQARGVAIRSEDIEALVSEGVVERTPGGGLRPSREVTRERAPGGEQARWEGREVLEAIIAYANLTGEAPSKRHLNAAALARAAERGRARAREAEARLAIYSLGLWPCETTVRKHFGSWPAAVREAGFAPRGRGRPSGGAPVAMPKTGPAALEAAAGEVTKARESGDELALCEALRKLGAAALIEAEEIESRSDE
jgi:hypothetical protein